jgi:hypothetical protein
VVLDEEAGQAVLDVAGARGCQEDGQRSRNVPRPIEQEPERHQMDAKEYEGDKETQVESVKR